MHLFNSDNLKNIKMKNLIIFTFPKVKTVVFGKTAVSFFFYYYAINYAIY